MDKNKKNIIKEIIQSNRDVNIQRVVSIARKENRSISYKDVLDLLQDGAIGLRNI